MRTRAFFNKNRINLWLLIYCVASFTIFQFIPVYFTQEMPRLVYYVLVYITLVISSVTGLWRYFQRTKQYLFTKTIAPIFLLFGLLVALLFIASKFLAVWSEAGTYYTSKTNPEVKIISRYIDLGALGGGTKPDDYEVVLHRPLPPFFKMETAIDTNKVDKKDWIKH